MVRNDNYRPADWVGSSKKDLMAFPRSVVHDIGYAITVAQHGGRPKNAKPLRRYGGGVLEVIENFDKDTYRAVYTVRFSDRIYVLHCFQKKSRRGIKMGRKDQDLIDQRLKAAAAIHNRRQTEGTRS